MAEFELVVFRVGLPGLPNEIDSIGDLGHKAFAETESPIAIFVVREEADGVAASVGSVIPGAVIVDGPVHELVAGVGADLVDIEEIGHAELAEAEFEAAARKFVE